MAIATFDDARAAVRSGTSPAAAAAELVSTMSPAERLWCLDGDGPTWAGLSFLSAGGYHRAPFHAARVERIGLPGVSFADGPRGCVIGNATAFPVSMARGATWDPDLEERIGDVVGRELRAAGATLTGAVCVNVLRHPAWGRAQETYGEDPLLVGELGAALTRGLQRHVLACVKHFACNSMENARFSVDVEVDEVALHEVYLPHFRRIVDEGVASVMSAYNSVNGEWAGQSHALLTEVLREEWGFEGFVISDWIFGLRDAASSLSAGLDIEMPYRMVRAQGLWAALDAGEASLDDVDTAVRRVVATLLRFDDVLSMPAEPRDVLGAPEHRALAREVAARSVVLLRNEPVDGSPVLPLASDARLAVIGRLADRINLGDGGSSDVWDLECHTILDGLRAAFADVTHDDGSDPERAASTAATADVAVVVVGYTYLDEGEFIGETDPLLGALFPPADEPEAAARFEAELAAMPATTTPEHLADRPGGFSVGGDRSSLRLPEGDTALIRAVAAANPRTVVVVQAGSAVVVTDWVGDVAAVVQSWYGGCQAGPGLADVLLGHVNPSARLPFSVPVDESDLPPFDRDATSFTYDRWHGWWHLRRIGRDPAFPFGFGLSYTAFAIGDVLVAVDGGALVVEGVVHNTGDRDGADVVQVYAARPDLEAPDRLVGFARVEVAAGRATPFHVLVPVDRLATRDAAAHAWRPAEGVHDITVARNATDRDAVTHRVDLTPRDVGAVTQSVVLDALRAALPPGAVVTDPDIVEAYRHDRAMTIVPGRPLAVVRPSSTAEVQATVAVAARFRVPLVTRGAGSGLSGGASAVEGCITLSTERMRAVTIDRAAMVAVVQPGLLNAELKAAARAEGLWYPPDPSSFEICSIGGNLATNAGGLCCVKYGVTTDYVLGLEVVLADGRIVRLGGRTVKDVAGYDLKRLFVGSEGTLGVVTEATLRLRPLPPVPTTIAATFSDVVGAGHAVTTIASSIRPSALELMDAAAIAAVEQVKPMGFDASVGALLIAQTDGPPSEADLVAAACREAGAADVIVSDSEAEGELLMAARRMVIPCVERLGAVLIEDVGVPIPRVPELVAAVAAIAARHDVAVPVIGHAGDGNFHPLVTFDPTDDDARARAAAAFDEIMDAALALGGTVTGEHGIGSLKARHLREQLGADVIDITRRLKEALDPNGILNPGKWV